MGKNKFKHRDERKHQKKIPPWVRVDKESPMLLLLGATNRNLSGITAAPNILLVFVSEENELILNIFQHRNLSPAPPFDSSTV